MICPGCKCNKFDKVFTNEGMGEQANRCLGCAMVWTNMALWAIITEDNIMVKDRTPKTKLPPIPEEHLGETKAYGKLLARGYEEVEPGLYCIVKDGIKIYHDYRKGSRQTYGYKGDKSINVRGTPEHVWVKLVESGQVVADIKEPPVVAAMDWLANSITQYLREEGLITDKVAFRFLPESIPFEIPEHKAICKLENLE